MSQEVLPFRLLVTCKDDMALGHLTQEFYHSQQTGDIGIDVRHSAKGVVPQEHCPGRVVSMCDFKQDHLACLGNGLGQAMLRGLGHKGAPVVAA